MAKPLTELRQVRLDKLAAIKKLGVNPYPASSKRKELIKKALQLEGKKVFVAGRVRAMRGHGGIRFWDLEDESGQIQLVFRENQLDKKTWSLIDLIDIGDFVEVSGEVFRTKSSETSVAVEELSLLAKSLRPLPSKWHGLKDVEERYRQRYVDLLVNPEVRQTFYIRAKIITTMRRFLDERGFLEVETPVLQSMYGGASARPFVTHHHVLKSKFYLRISDELYLKRLIVGGFEKVYEISKDFRNEGIDRVHNPEFTMAEFYWAYADYEDLMKLTEEMLGEVLQAALGKSKVEYEGETLDFTPPFDRVYFRDLLLEGAGIDMDQIKTETELRQAIKTKSLDMDLKGAVGLGAIYDKIYKEKLRSKLVKPTFLLDYPASMIALAKRKEGDERKIATFQLVAGGVELIKAYNELNDPLDQKERWLESEKLLEKGDEEAQRLDEDYIRALEYGMPPTAGWGMGIDRFTAFITNQHSLKDVILFPTLRREVKEADEADTD